jgi:DNA-binding NarL/FixJ family response regulator
MTRPAEGTMKPTTLLTVGENGRRSAELRAALEPIRDLQIVGTARNLREGAELARLHQPDVILLHLGRLEFARCVKNVLQMRRYCPSAQFIVFTTVGPDRNPTAAARSANPPNAKTLIEAIAGPVGAEESGESQETALTVREAEVAALAAQGYSNAQIAQRLYVSVNTVKTHMAHVLSKLRLKRRIDLARLWEARRGRF